MTVNSPDKLDLTNKFWYVGSMDWATPQILEMVAVGAIAMTFELPSEDIFSPGKYKKRVQARSVLCYWAVRELGETASNLAQKIGISQPAVSQAVERGEKIVKELKLEL